MNRKTRNSNKLELGGSSRYMIQFLNDGAADDDDAVEYI